MNWKGCGRKRLWPNLKYYAGILLEELKKTTKNLSQVSPSKDWDLNLEPPEYEAGVLTAQPQRSVTFAVVEGFWDLCDSLILVNVLL
jgi:hypothetical protein